MEKSAMPSLILLMMVQSMSFLVRYSLPSLSEARLTSEKSPRKVFRNESSSICLKACWSVLSSSPSCVRAISAMWLQRYSGLMT